tara:strand:+ start:71 stop:691 length:621 start_codon:yes stop_codon:yes gene_type:complete
MLVEQRYPFDLNEMFFANPLMATIKLARFKFVAKMLNKKDRVLDLGCGNGFSSYFYSHFCKSVHGVDIQEAVINNWECFEHENISFSLGNILNDEIYEKDIEAITCVDVIEHFSLSDGEKIIENAAKCLSKQKNGGQFIIGTPSKFSNPFRAEHNKEHHLHEYEPDELQNICERYFPRTLQFSMNDEIIHTGFNKLAWFFYIICIT